MMQTSRWEVMNWKEREPYWRKTTCLRCLYLMKCCFIAKFVLGLLLLAIPYLLSLVSRLTLLGFLHPPHIFPTKGGYLIGKYNPCLNYRPDWARTVPPGGCARILSGISWWVKKLHRWGGSPMSWCLGLSMKELGLIHAFIQWMYNCTGSVRPSSVWWSMNGGSLGLSCGCILHTDSLSTNGVPCYHTRWGGRDMHAWEQKCLRHQAGWLI